MLIKVAFALLPLLAVGVCSELLWRKSVLRGEGGRKFIHILSGVWVSLWPLYLPMKAISILAAGLLIGLIISRNLQIFHAVYDVKRRTFGEYFYPLAILLCAILAESRWQFSLAILLLAAADGLAAVVGTRYKKQAHEYKVWGQQKSVLGTITYFASSIFIFWFVGAVYAQEVSWSAVLLLSAFAALLENVLPYGSDNLVIPVGTVLLLTSVV